MSNSFGEVTDIILALEAELRRLQLWDSKPPEPAALLSRQPFAIDTLEFYQWLQFIFIPRVTLLVETQGELPQSSAIAPMAEHYFQGLGYSEGRVSGERVVELLRRFDAVITL